MKSSSGALLLLMAALSGSAAAADVWPGDYLALVATGSGFHAVYVAAADGGEPARAGEPQTRTTNPTEVFIR